MMILKIIIFVRKVKLNSWTLSLLLSSAILFLFIYGGNVAEWSACRTRNPAIPGSSPALITTWIYLFPARLPRIQILGHASKQPTGLPPARWDS